MIGMGIDVGGSGIKGAPVDLETGEFTADRLRIPTPPRATPDQVLDIMKQIVDNFDLPDKTRVGISFNAPVSDGVVRGMPGLHPDWADFPLAKAAKKKLGFKVKAINDADAAGFGEAELGGAKGHGGKILMLTLGTGIGSALIYDHRLIPNFELGHLTLPIGIEAEKFAASSVYEREDLSYQAWAKRLQIVFDEYENLFSPDLILIGGGISKKHEKYLPLINTKAELLPATLFNRAGIVGAALYAATRIKG